MTPPPSFQFRSIDELRGKSEPDLLRFFMDACPVAADVQRAVLLDILRRNEQTEFGRAHAFADITSVEEYRRRVPIGDWSHHAPLAKRMETGEPNLLFAGAPCLFIATSGTTGAMKWLPESPDGAFAKSTVSRMRTALLAKMAPEIMDGFFLPLANAVPMGRTSGGIPVGYASGLTLADTSPELLRRMAVPPAAMKSSDPAATDYLIMRFSVAQPRVRVLAGNNPGRMTSLLETADKRRDAIMADIENGTIANGLALPLDLRRELETGLSPNPARAEELRRMVALRGRLDPRDYWPGLRLVACWLGGTIGRYLEGLKPWLPETVAFVDLGYGASEGKINVPMKPGTTAGPLAIFGAFFEFQPLSGGAPLMAHELEPGQECELLLTTYSGLYRYALRDIVRATGFLGQNPCVEFVSKTKDVANLAGEKVTGGVLSDVVRQTLAARGLRWKHFCVVADADRHRYDLCVEPDGASLPDPAWIAEFDRSLMERHPLYLLNRKRNLIRPPRLVVMKCGWLDHLYAERLAPGATTTQIKLPVVCDGQTSPGWIDRVLDA